MNNVSVQEKYYHAGRGPDLRRTPVEERRHWQVNEMWDVHHEIARMISLGMKNVTIAEKLNVTPQLVSNVRNSPIVQDQIAVLRGARDAETIDVAREIKEYAPTALSLLKEIVEGKGNGQNATIGLRAKTAESFMDRAGYAAPKKIESISAHLTTDEIREIKQRAMSGSDFVDGEFSEATPQAHNRPGPRANPDSVEPDGGTPSAPASVVSQNNRDESRVVRHEMPVALDTEA